MRILLPLFGLVLAAAVDAQQIDSMLLRTHTRVLAADSLEGRGAGSRGERAAARYIEEQLRQLELEPVSGNGYQLPVPLERATIRNAELAISGRDGTRRTFRNRTDFVWNTGSREAFRSFEGPAAYLTDPRDTSEASLRGRVIVVVGTLGADAAWLVPLWQRHGVQAVLSIIPDSAQYELINRSRGDARFFTAGADDPIWQSPLPVVIGSPRLGRALLGARLDSLTQGGPAVEQLGLSIRATIEPVFDALPTTNLAAVLPGTDSVAKGMVVYTAHYDHLGIGEPNAQGDSIFNGFSDNAAGVAMLLAIADAMRRDPPAHPVAFLFFAAEERGLLGSSYFASNPPFPLQNIKGVINLDGGSPPAPPVEWRMPTNPQNGPVANATRTVAARHGWTVEFGPPSPNSDYWPFAIRGVPVGFLIPCFRWENLSDAEREQLRQRWDHYHQLEDEWHPEYPFSGMRRYAQFALEIGFELAR